jgi:hypothetical protein
MSEPSVQCACDVALGRTLGQALNEEAFRHLLAVERKRAEAGRGSLLLVLVRFNGHPANNGRVPPGVAEKLFAGLGRSVRDMDIVGWFREGAVAAAVLPQGANQPPSAALPGIRARVSETVSAWVPRGIRAALRVRILHLTAR